VRPWQKQDIFCYAFLDNFKQNSRRGKTTMKRIALAISGLTLASCAFLTACSSGSGGGSTSPAATPTGEATPTATPTGTP
jgi:hypothetical protein